MPLGNCIKCCLFKRNVEEEVISKLDYSNTNLEHFPEIIWQNERTLSDLLLSSTRLSNLPPQLFYCQNLRLLNISNNNLESIPDAIGKLRQLQHLNISKNFISSIPDSIRNCKSLTCLDLSSNSLQRLPDAITCLLTLQELFLNETYLEFLPANFGRLVNLRILELRLNSLVTLPKSMGRLANLQRLDIGGNEFTELPFVIGELCKLRELWVDYNQIQRIPAAIGKLQDLHHFEANNNVIESLPDDISNWSNVEVLSIGLNALSKLPKNLAYLTSLVTFKCESCKLTTLPSSISNLEHLEELVLSHNRLTSLPTTIGMLRNLRFVFLDDNLLEELPDELCSCSALSVLSVSRNRLTDLPHNIGRLTNLKVLNVVGNNLETLPFSILHLLNLTSLWIGGNQTQPLVPLQFADSDKYSGALRLTCLMLPQSEAGAATATTSSGPQENGGQAISAYETNNTYSAVDTYASVCPSRRICFAGDVNLDKVDLQLQQQEQNQQQQSQPQNHFTADIFSNDEDQCIPPRLMRTSTPYPKELRMMAKYMLRSYDNSNTVTPQRSPQFLNIKEASVVTNRDGTQQSTLISPSNKFSSFHEKKNQHSEHNNFLQEDQKHNNDEALTDISNVDEQKHYEATFDHQKYVPHHTSLQCEEEALLQQQSLPISDQVDAYAGIYKTYLHDYEANDMINSSSAPMNPQVHTTESYLPSPPPYDIARNYTKKTQQDLSNYETMRRYQKLQEINDSLLQIDDMVHEINCNQFPIQGPNGALIPKGDQDNCFREINDVGPNLNFQLDNQNNVLNNSKPSNKISIDENELTERGLAVSSVDRNSPKPISNKRTPWLFGVHKNPTVKQITLKKEDNDDPGFIIGNIVNEMGIYVLAVVPMSNAARLLMVRDKLLEINGRDFTSIGLDEANDILKSAGTLLNIMLSRK